MDALMKVAVKIFTALALFATIQAQAATPAKKLFGNKKLEAANMKPQVFGSYARGCLAGGEKLADDGPTWQAMRLYRNRHWAHPELIQLIKKLSVDGRKVGWNGLLVGDLTQPRGGPMSSGHASHQAGLDADIWLTPMPNRRLTREERNKTFQPTSMLKRRANGKLTNQSLGRGKLTKAHVGIIRTAAKYPNVERMFVHPTIKRELCRQYPSHPAWLRKVRAQFGHHYHMHIRIGCPAGSPKCKPQKAVPSMGCDKATMDYWFKVAYGPPRKPKPGAKKRKPKPPITLARLPSQCRIVLNAPAKGRKGAAVAKPTSVTDLIKANESLTTPTARPVQ